MFPSLCLVSENAIFGGGKKEKKKKVCKPIGDPVRGRDAPINTRLAFVLLKRCHYKYEKKHSVIYLPETYIIKAKQETTVECTICDLITGESTVSEQCLPF